MSTALKQAMLCDEEPAAADLDRYAYTGVRVLLADCGEKA